MCHTPGHDEPHDHHHGHGGHHGHSHGADEFDPDTAAALDASIADGELSPTQLSRRSLFRSAGIVGGATALGMAGVTPAMAEGRGRPAATPVGNDGIKHWLAGDHHIHTQFSSDAMYRVIDQVQHGAAYGLDWMVITDHGGATHSRIGVELVNPDIRAARELLPDTLVFQGLEWNIPAAEHGTVFVAPGPNEVSVLKQFETDYDGGVNGWGASTPANEAQAVAGITWLGAQVDGRRIDDALFLANHPARQGIDSPHEIRAWRDADPRVAVGFEGAPGHQAAGLPAGIGAGSARGFYAGGPNANSFPGYPLESYRTWGGFDWMTATVGGLWDSLLAEGKPWSISANSDSHVNWGDTSRRPDGSSSEQFNRDGRYGAPVHGGTVNLTAGDFWPGFYSRTHVGAAARDYLSVMKGLRDGRVWVDHGRLVKNVDVTVRMHGSREPGVPLGSTLQVRYGARLDLVIRITAQDQPNWAQFVPQLNRVDLIQGMVDPTGAAADRDTFAAPDTKVVEQWDTSGRTGTFEIVHRLPAAYDPFYVRLRGTDGNRSQPGYLGTSIDPEGPALDVVGDADPWVDLWFYTNPIWVVPTR
ncbi:histidinol-phosphatase [Jiangella asiatica]|uniref:Histidinol-phosphatase n=1 Tax=Jiangella asiatica TaxID=2530372 RepID=A0A4R5DHG2_9ACTN|nr:histidinol-phosphatase [Jiangella asiatica]TDE13512.1 histidinol-phosphatase [Jiangella asiatica]